MVRSVPVLAATVASAISMLTMPAAAGAVATCDAPGDFALVEGQGPSCRAGELWTVLLQNGDRLLTHGSDPVPTATAFDAPARPPACVDDTQHRNELIYARPVDRAGRYDQSVPVLRSLVAQANGRLHADSVRHGAAIDYAFLCDAGRVVVHYAVLAATSQDDSFASIVSGLQSLGYRDARVKYWVLYDDGVAGQAAGQGNVHRDDRLVADNANNGGPDYGISYDTFDARLLMHENAHNMGAVQLSAPHSSGGWHCNDGHDVMCYADGATGSAYVDSACSTLHFDCGSDDYFHPSPAAGSYLATHWNVGSPLNRFLRRGLAPPTAPTPTAPPPTQATPPPTSGTGGSATPAADTRAPFVRLRVARRIATSRLRRSGLPTTVTCTERCRLVVQLRTRGRRTTTLGVARRSFAPAGTRRRVVVRLTLRGRAVLARRAPRAVSLRVLAVDRAGNARTVGRVVYLR